MLHFTFDLLLKIFNLNYQNFLLNLFLFLLADYQLN